MFWIWLSLEVGFLGSAAISALKGDWKAITICLIIGAICQNNRIAEATKARERMRHYGGHR